MSYTVQDYILTAKLAQKKLKQYHEMNRMNCISCRDIESDDGGYVFAEYNINDSKKDIKELKEYVNTINHIIESSNYCGYVEMPEYPKSFGLLILYGNNCPLDETKILHYKNPDGALKNKITRKKNSNIRSGKRANAHISPSPKKGKPKKEEVEDLEEIVDDISEIAEDAKRILYKEISSYQNIYQEVMLPYAISESYAIIDWNLQNIQEQDRIRFLKNKSSIYEYCSKIFNDTHSLYKMGMDEHCIYIQKI